MTKEIIDYINTELGIDITKRKRTNEYVFARTIYYKLARELTNLSLEEIGSHVNKDHCSVLHNLKNFREAAKRPDLNKIYYTFKENPVLEDRASYSEVVKINNNLSSEIRTLRAKYNDLLAERKGETEIEASRMEDLLRGLNEDQLDLIYTRLDAMVKMVRSIN